MLGAWFFVLLAAEPAAPSPARPIADVARHVTAVLDACDPKVTPPANLCPIAELKAAAELAEDQLERGDLGAGDLEGLVGLVHDTRALAYLRTRDPRHLCSETFAMVAAGASPVADPTVRRVAFEWSAHAKALLADDHPTHVCEDDSGMLAVSQPRRLVHPTPPPRPRAHEDLGRPLRPGLAEKAVGGTMLAVAIGFVAATGGVAYWRNEMIEKGLKLQMKMESGYFDEDLRRERDQFLADVKLSRAMTAGFVAAAAASTAIGTVLVVAGHRRARVAPYGGPLGGGLMIHGRF